MVIVRIDRMIPVGQSPSFKKSDHCFSVHTLLDWLATLSKSASANVVEIKRSSVHTMTIYRQTHVMSLHSAALMATRVRK